MYLLERKDWLMRKVGRARRRTDRDTQLCLSVELDVLAENNS